jgi:REP element-mobilizing transposase RayT
VHVTLRVAEGLPSFRNTTVFAAVRGALARGSSASFRILHFSVQKDHVHLMVEADRPDALSRGIQGLAIRAAKTVNRILHRRGRVWGDRFHAHLLSRPREVRNALVYVLNNWRKHVPGAHGLDPRSSARWFSGWRQRAPAEGLSPVAAARTWLASVGWLRHGRIGMDEAPRRSLET